MKLKKVFKVHVRPDLIPEGFKEVSYDRMFTHFGETFVIHKTLGCKKSYTCSLYNTGVALPRNKKYSDLPGTVEECEEQARDLLNQHGRDALREKLEAFKSINAPLFEAPSLFDEES
jgi:hypothetical protein